MRYILFYLLVLVALFSCSDDISGGSDNPDFMAGIIVDTVGQPIKNAEVLLIKSDFNPAEDNPETIERKYTNESGEFSFQTKSDETYTLEVYNPGRELSAISSQLASDADTTITLKQSGTLQILVNNKSSLNSGSLSFTGTTLLKTVETSVLNDSVDIVTLENMPSGTYAQAYFSGISTQLFESPVQINSSDTTTLILDDSTGTVKPLWRFPLTIGVQESTMTHYGGMLAITQKIMTQISQVEQAFKDERIKGIIEFSIDSIYSFQGSMADENTPIADTTGFLILYDAFNTSINGVWNKYNRIIFHDHTDHEGDSLFSSYSTQHLIFEMGLARGCYYLSAMEVADSNNSISNTAYEPAPTIMHQRSSTLWSDLSIELINHYGETFSILPDTAKHSSSDSIEFILTDENSVPITNAQISLYGVTPHSRTVDIQPTFTNTTDEKGMATSTGALFKGNDPTIQDYSNFLVEVTVSNTTQYYWLPFEEVGIHYQKTGEKRYRKGLLFTK